MLDRLTYALVGAVFGAIIAIACWFLYGLAFSAGFPGVSINRELGPWLKGIAGLFAVLGFLFKDRVGSVVGDTIALLFTAESGKNHGPNLSFWKSIIWLAVIGLIIWYLASTSL
jgi:hypothetical protein